MIQKIQTLQKRLISKTEEVVEKDLLIQEKESCTWSSRPSWRASPDLRWRSRSLCISRICARRRVS